MIRITSLLAVLSLYLCPLTAATSVSRHGITWTFDGDYATGQFANGDWWVVGPVNITGITPVSTEDTGGRTMHGAMLNPTPRNGTAQGYDSHMYTYGGIYSPNYSDTLNAALDVSARNPLTITTGSLVSSISHPEEGPRPQSAMMAVLTVVGTVPAAGSFRPAYCSIDKSIVFNASQLDYSLLGSLAMIPDIPDMADVAAWFEAAWIDHVPNWPGDEPFHHSGMPNYSRDMAGQVSIGAMMLNMDFTDTEKETLFIRMVQLGIDNYGVVQDGGTRNWIPNGGHANGRFFPILLAGMALGDSAMAAIGERDDVLFGETGQTFYVSQAEIDMTAGASWNPDSRNDSEPYTQSDLGLPEWGITHINNPQCDDASWGAVYRQCCTAMCWSGQLQASLVMGVKDRWHHDVLFDYQDRYVAIETANLRFWGNTSTSDGFLERVWEAHRPAYGGTYAGLDTVTHERIYDYSACVHDCGQGSVVDGTRTEMEHPAAVSILNNPVDRVLLLNGPVSGVIVDHTGVPVGRVAQGKGSVAHLADGMYFFCRISASGTDLRKIVIAR